jgi:hypothetical protein
MKDDYGVKRSCIPLVYKVTKTKKDINMIYKLKAINKITIRNFEGIFLKIIKIKN